MERSGITGADHGTTAVIKIRALSMDFGDPWQLAPGINEMPDQYVLNFCHLSLLIDNFDFLCDTDNNYMAEFI
jgi:hypothetical protein